MAINEITFKPKDEQLNFIIDSFCSRKHLLSNYYGLPNDDVSYYLTGKTLLLKCQFDNFCRLYLMSDDVDEVKDLLSRVSGNCAINIPTRKELGIWNEILLESGFNHIATYSRFVYSDYKKGHIHGLSFAVIGDLPKIQSELLNFFDPITGHLPSKEELEDLIVNECIVVNRDVQGLVSGAICYKVKGRVAELPFWFDIKGNGLNLLYNIYKLCHEKGLKKISFWVNDKNAATARLHKLLGAKEDGLQDYIYTNQ